MPKKINLALPLNRVEGDLEIRVEIDDGVVSDAWCAGTLYRGFERILVGRGALDGLVITPRICGICGTAHLTAAARALEAIGEVTPGEDAVRVRNVALMTEHIQSDLRQGFLMFTADFVNPAYADHPLYPEVVRRFEPFKGEAVVEVIRQTKKVLEIVAIVGGQWPHSSYMVPGGIASRPSASQLRQCRLLLKQYRLWYEQRVLGCSVERWLELQSSADLDAWLDQSEAHRESHLGLFVRFARALGLDRVGRGHDNFLSFGGLDLPPETAVSGTAGTYLPTGFLHGGQLDAFDPSQVTEHVAHSWFVDYEGGRHPSRGETRPYATGEEGAKYSWAKAPRYAGEPAETGPLAERLIAGDPLLANLVATQGATVFVRQLARLTRPCHLMPAMDAWIGETRAEGSAEFYRASGELTDGEGWGLTQAARGALGHWVRIANGEIAHYQIITPTAWNASPRDARHLRGPIEQALVGTAVRDSANPVEIGHVVRSFDPCLVCTVHFVDLRHPARSGRRSLAV